ncbi:MAG TPA: arylesterase [Gammaproteobacteria bacterium]
MIAGVGGSAASANERTLLILGDSLSTAYNIDAGSGWVSLLERRLATQGYSYRIVNASISGDTSRGAAARLDAVLSGTRPDLAVVELGGNDGLRGVALAELRRNLESIIRRLRDAGSAVLLVSVKLPPNYGATYTAGFEKVYADLGTQFGVRVGGFLLEDIALRPELMQEDGIHPTAEAQALILENIWKDLEPLLHDSRQREPAS